jgi:hypothetical protein
MRSRCHFILSGVAALVIFAGMGCVSEKKTRYKDAPQWYRQLPDDSVCVLASAPAQAARAGAAVTAATEAARDTLAVRLFEKFFLGEITRVFTTDPVEMPQWYVDASRKISERAVKGTAPLETEMRELKPGVYRAYTMVGVPRGAASKQLLTYLQNTLPENGERFVRFRSWQAFKRLKRLAGTHGVQPSCER